MTDCAIAADGSYFVSASLDGTLKLWEAKMSAHAAVPQQHIGWVNACAVNGDAGVIVTASSDTTLNVWNESLDRPRLTLAGHEDSVRGCAVGTSGREIVSASADKSLKIWNAREGTLRGHRDWVNSCSVSPDERLLVSASSDKTLRIWDGQTRAKRLRVVAHADSINACAFSPSGEFFVSASADTSLKVWATARARDVWESPLGDEHTGSEGHWDALLKPLILAAHNRPVNACAVAPDSTFIVSASSDRTLKIWDVTDREALSGSSDRMARVIVAPRRTLTGHRDDVNGCAVSPDGTLIASASEDKTLRIWSVATGECLTTLHVDGALTSCIWLPGLPDGERIVATGASGVYFLVLCSGRRRSESVAALGLRR